MLFPLTLISDRASEFFESVSGCLINPMRSHVKFTISLPHLKNEKRTNSWCFAYVCITFIIIRGWVTSLLIHKLGVSHHLFSFLFECFSLTLYHFLCGHLGQKYFASFISKNIVLFYAIINGSSFISFSICCSIIWIKFIVLSIECGYYNHVKPS